MDLTCFNWAQIIKKSSLPANAKYLALYLATFMNAEHDIAWPSLRRISSETGLSLSTVQKYLAVLEASEYLTKRSSAHTANTAGGDQRHNEYLINFPSEVYREAAHLLSTGIPCIDTPNSKGVPTDEQRCTDWRPKVYREAVPNNNINNNRSNKGATTHSAKRGSRLPSTWEPSLKDIAYLHEKRPDLKLTTTTENFRDYWTSIPGAKGRKLDWHATWRTWVRKEAAPREHRGNGAGRSDSEWQGVGRQLGVKPKVGESMQNFIERVKKAERDHGTNTTRPA